jgi:hypothetical protein
MVSGLKLLDLEENLSNMCDRSSRKDSENRVLILHTRDVLKEAPRESAGLGLAGKNLKPSA